MGKSREKDCTAEFNYNTLASRAKAFDHSTYMYVIEQGSCKNEYGIGCGTRSPELLYLSKISWDYKKFPSLRNYVKKKESYKYYQIYCKINKRFMSSCYNEYN